MSLQVWLPLNGNLTQQGTSGITVVNNGATVNTSGKIGSCYAFNGSTSYIALSGSDLFKIFTGGTQQFSITMWVFHADTTRAILFGDYATSGGIGFNIELSTSHAVRFYWNGSPDTYPANATIAASGWTHVALTYDGTKLQSYINGVEKGSWSGTLAVKNKTSGEFRLGRDNRSDSTAFNGRMNDFRIYDHALSAAEVKEISQGLVLHYKLDGLNNASILPTQYQQLEYIESAGTSYFDTGYKFDITNDEFKVIFKGNDTSNNGMIFASSSTPYIWLYYYGSSGIRIYADNGSNGQQGITGIASDLNQHTAEFKNKTYYIDGSNKGTLSNTYGNTRNNMWLFSYGGNSYPFKGRIYYVEVKNNSTYKRIFIPAKRLSDAAIGMYDLITQTFYTSSNTAFTAGSAVGTLTIQDNSGYNHNGTISGNLSLNNNTPRYQFSTYFEDYTRYISCLLDNNWIPDSITMSCWIKGTNRSARGGFHIPLNMHSTNFEISITSSSGLARMGYVIGGTRYVSDIGSNILDGNWHMLTSTFNGSTICRYIDGTLVNSENRSGALTAVQTLGIGAFPGGTTYGNTQLYESDVRIYATALTAADILELYHTGAKIDNKQNLHTFEVKEQSENMFRSELIMPWAKPNRTRIGEIVEHNGYMALNIAPEPFYNNISSTTSGALDGMFQAGSYVFDIWVDVDSVISGGTNRAGGMIIRYSDNTSENAFVFTGGNLGYQHKIYITPANKTVQRLEFYYYTSTDVFYRIDSCIYPINATKIFKSGIVQSGGFLEDTKMRIIKNSLIETNEIIEL